MKKIIEFGVPNPSETYRKTAIIVLFNCRTGKFFYCDRPEYGLCCLISGGLEGDEDYLHAAEREIQEETGYVNFKMVAKFPGRILTHYYMAAKNEYRAKQIQAYVYMLMDEEKKPKLLEEDENFILKEAYYEELLTLMRGYKDANGFGLEDHMEILKWGKKTLEVYKKFNPRI